MSQIIREYTVKEVEVALTLAFLRDTEFERYWRNWIQVVLSWKSNAVEIKKIEPQSYFTRFDNFFS
jgi:hypothetical protein